MRQFFILAVAFFAAQFSARADLLKSSVLESNIAYLRVGEIGKNLADEIHSAQIALAMTNKMVGTILDLRFADGDDLDSGKNVEKIFEAEKLPLAILINSETRGAAADLAAQLRAAQKCLLIGNADPKTKPDIAVNVSAADEKIFQQNPFADLGAGKTEKISTNDFLPFVDHTSEAELVRKHIKDGDDDEDTTNSPRAEIAQPVVRDPVLARALDWLEALAILQPARG